MINFFNNFIITSFFVIGITLPNVSFAGEIMPEGTELAEESYVFTIEEATALLARIEELEAKEKKLDMYLQLEEVRMQQIDLYKLNLDYSQEQINRYSNLMVTNQDLIDRYNKRDRLQTWENVGFLALGIGLTVSAFLVADSVTDHMETNNLNAISF